MYNTLRVAGIVQDSITDGPGLRLTIFLQGCPRSCPGCHNQEALPLDGGTPYTVDALLTMVRKNPLLSGVTLSGGEPLLQASALLPLVREIKNDGLSLIVYTGYTFEELLKQADADVMALLSYADTLIDGPYMEKERSLTLLFRGSRNQRILTVQASLLQKEAVEEAWQ
jgi:anaerobic ribonucleoside-triphosphate reductase activating protein